MSSLFEDSRYSSVTWAIPARDEALSALQTFWVYTQIKGLIPFCQGPSWCSQKRKAASMASLGKQRAAGVSSRGLDHMFPPGLGPAEHMKRSLQEPSPIALSFTLDEDLSFAIYALEVWGPYLSAWRNEQMSHLEHLHRSLAQVDSQLVALMDPYVHQVAKDRFPAGIAANVVLLRWPDRQLPRCFVEGFAVIGEVPESSVFKRLPDKPVLHDIYKDFFGAPAVKFVNSLERSKPRQSPKLNPLVHKEFEKGRFYNEMSRDEADILFGRGKWRPMPLFLVEQPSKDRIISDACRGGQNEAVHEIETIYVPSVDFIPEVIQALSTGVRSSSWWKSMTGSSHTEEQSAEPPFLPEWAQPLMGTEDLDEAYGQCPAKPEHRGACVVAWYDPVKGWRYAEAKGLVFGLSAAVIGFNRWPILITSAFRRFLAGLGTNYFDDFCVLSTLADATTARNGLVTTAKLCGGTFGRAKTIPPGTARAFIGVYADLSEAAGKGILSFKPREECVRSIKETADKMLQSRRCTPAAASKLRGKSGWASTHLFAKIGRVGLSALKTRQYYEGTSHKITQQLKEALAFLTQLHRVPPRFHDLRRDRGPPLVIYSDASWPSRRDGSKEIVIPRIGWVIFDPLDPGPPRGFSMRVEDSVLKHLIVREQQILAVEAFAAAAAPWASPEIFRGRDSIWFVDNSSAVSTLIRGSAKPEDIDNISAMVTLQNSILDHGVWFEWIDSDSNPSDGLSRLGLEDPWTLEQGWKLAEVSEIAWSDLFKTFALESLQSQVDLCVAAAA
jgi:hypothetical protein